MERIPQRTPSQTEQVDAHAHGQPDANRAQRANVANASIIADEFDRSKVQPEFLALDAKDPTANLHSSAEFLLKRAKDLSQDQMNQLLGHARKQFDSRGFGSRAKDFWSFLPGVSESSVTRAYKAFALLGAQLKGDQGLARFKALLQMSPTVSKTPIEQLTLMAESLRALNRVDPSHREGANEVLQALVLPNSDRLSEHDSIDADVLNQMVGKLAKLPSNDRQTYLEALRPFIGQHKLSAKHLPFISKIIDQLAQVRGEDRLTAMQEMTSAKRYWNYNFDVPAPTGLGRWLVPSGVNAQEAHLKNLGDAVKDIKSGKNSAAIKLAQDKQSTHRSEVHLSVAQSVERLMKRYPDATQNAAQVIFEIRKEIQARLNAKPNNDKELKAKPKKDAELRHALTALGHIEARYSEFREAQTKQSIAGALALVWAGIHDKGSSKGTELSDQDIQDREGNLIRCLAEAATEYGPSNPACTGGTFNKVVEALDRTHDDVTIVRNFAGIVSDVLQDEYRRIDAGEGSADEKKAALQIAVMNRLKALVGEDAIVKDKVRLASIEKNIKATGELFD
jgi:hypothetical protein